MKKITFITLALASTIGFGSLLASRAETMAQAVKEHTIPSERAVLHDPDIPALGNLKGDVTIVEFFDYQCPYCRKLHPDLMRLLMEDRKIRLVLKDWPILSPSSQAAGRTGEETRR